MNWIDEKIAKLKLDISASPDRRPELILRALHIGAGSDGYNNAPIEQLVTPDNITILSSVLENGIAK